LRIPQELGKKKQCDLPARLRLDWIPDVRRGFSPSATDNRKANLGLERAPAVRTHRPGHDLAL